MNTKTQNALKMAKEIAIRLSNSTEHKYTESQANKIIALIDEALAQRAQDHSEDNLNMVQPTQGSEVQEPVAYYYPDDNSAYILWHGDTDIPNDAMPLYTHPAPAREWQGLSDDEIVKRVFEDKELLNRILYLHGVSKGLEQALRIKNENK